MINSVVNPNPEKLIWEGAEVFVLSGEK